MVISHTDDQAPFRERAAALGIRTAFEADDHGYQIWQLHPGDTGGSFLEIDFQPGGDDPNGPWMPAGPDWQRAVRTDVVDAITAVELAVPDPDTTSARWRETPRPAALRQRRDPVVGGHRRSRRGRTRRRHDGQPPHRRRRVQDLTTTPEPQNRSDPPLDLGLFVELKGIEPLTPSMPWKCSTN